MRVMVTGATGFIGYHTAIALLDAGHELSLLVRSVEKMDAMFGAGRIDDYTVGDITDIDSVRTALQDCDAVIHVAALVSTRAADADRVGRTNVEGVENVIGSAVEMGVDSIVHVSSITALFDPAAQVLDEHSPPGVGATGYGRSKVACERFVRELQDSGAPVYITYPGTVLGPQTPALTEAHVGLQTYLSAFVPVMSSGNQYVDARDLAEAHRIIVEDSTLAARPGPMPGTAAISSLVATTTFGMPATRSRPARNWARWDAPGSEIRVPICISGCFRTDGCWTRSSTWHPTCSRRS